MGKGIRTQPPCHSFKTLPKEVPRANPKLMKRLPSVRWELVTLAMRSASGEVMGLLYDKGTDTEAVIVEE